MQKVKSYISIIPKLGVWNVIYILWYRFSLKTGIRKYWFPVYSQTHPNTFFLDLSSRKSNIPAEWHSAILHGAKKILSGSFRYYAFHWKYMGEKPQWFLNPFTGQLYPHQLKHWTKLSDFNKTIGDIKHIWEVSRFEWVVTLAKAYAITLDTNYLLCLNRNLRSWVAANPINCGPNWKCGQEASIRVFNLIHAAHILDQVHSPTDGLSDLIFDHLQRIDRNFRYALTQNNNHGTSEAAALFVGSGWLQRLNKEKYSKADRWVIKGRKNLEKVVNRLISKDGSFSQHSVTYHRVLLDTLCFAEYWRKHFNVSSFSNQFYVKARAAINWLWHFTDHISGNAPNLGNNDGAFFLNLHSCPYRDFRPTLQLAGFLFNKQFLYKEGPWNESLFWLGANFNDATATEETTRNSLILDGSYSILTSTKSWGFVRLPHFKFRPFHGDVFHFDLWSKGKNIICDGGSYSYHTPDSDLAEYFKSVKSHNTVMFNHHEQMPRLGPFLLGNWLKAKTSGNIEKQNDGSISWSGSYVDSAGHCHHRTISLLDNQWLIKDDLSGSFQHVTIGFNIDDEYCKIVGQTVHASFGVLHCPENALLELSGALVSEHYMEKRSIRRLLIKANRPGVYITRILLS